jgi:hypothetical protein
MMTHEVRGSLLLAEERFVGERNKDEVEIVFMYVWQKSAMKDIMKTSNVVKLRCPMSIRRFLLMLLIVNGNVGTRSAVDARLRDLGARGSIRKRRIVPSRRD